MLNICLHCVGLYGCLHFTS
uniref:Uncharacterized protein n=1 Tax=Anguilla anguilla TaxID=7936 RepID=A0A0E9XWH1_ANGAN